MSSWKEIVTGSFSGTATGNIVDPRDFLAYKGLWIDLKVTALSATSPTLGVALLHYKSDLATQVATSGALINFTTLAANSSGVLTLGIAQANTAVTPTGSPQVGYTHSGHPVPPFAAISFIVGGTWTSCTIPWSVWGLTW